MDLFGASIGTQSGAITATAVGLLAFGIGYNWLVLQLGRHGYDDGYTWLLVVVGVAATVIVAGFTIGWHTVALLGLYFAASGLPMALGDIYRHVRARRAERND